MSKDWLCPSCGHKNIDEGGMFCSYCGKKRRFIKAKFRLTEESRKQLEEAIKALNDLIAITKSLSPTQLYPYRKFQANLDVVRSTTGLFSASVPTYYSSEELSILQEPMEVPKKSAEATRFIERLGACPKGKEHWVEFQDLCKEILSHLFVPPLVEPFEQSRTETGLHVRDLIFDIPYSVRNNFWAYIRDKFDSLALVVECKNYSSPIEGNQIVISSKYLGKNKLGRFGIVFSRLEPAKSAIGEMKRLWREDDKLVLCMMDAHLIKMLKLKGQNKEPEIEIDNTIREFIRAME